MEEKENKIKDVSDIFEKIEDLAKQGHQLLQDGDIGNSYLAYEQAVELAEECKESFTLRACLFNLGACCIAKGDASKGLQFLLRAIPTDKNSDGSLNFADLHYNLAVAYDILGKGNEAKKSYEICLENYKNSSNLEMQGEVLLKLGGTCITLNMLKEACETFENGENIYQQLLDERHELLCVSSRATLLAEMRNDKCYELVNNIVERVENIKNDLLKAKICSDIGLVYTSSGNFDQAAIYLNKALSLIQSTDGDQKLQASVCQNLGAIHNQLGSFVKATIYHEKAIELYGLLGMRYAQGHAFSNLAFAFGQLGDLEKSRENFMHALQAAKDCQDFRGQWQANEGLSAVCFQKKDYEKAVSCLKSALTVLTFNGQVKDEMIHERIVAKLSNALEYQLKNNRTKNVRKEQDVAEEQQVVNIDGKVGQTRPREKNHKYVARGLDLDSQLSGQEDSDSTFGSITSYSGDSLSDGNEEKSKAAEIPDEPSNSMVVKKDPLNNTYEEPIDIINVLNANVIQKPVATSQETVQGNKNTKSKTCIIQ